MLNMEPNLLCTIVCMSPASQVSCDFVVPLRETRLFLPSVCFSLLR